jgi:flagellar export protein FliJ
MKRFRFDLARVLRLRQQQERAARLAMARDLSALHSLEEAQRQIDASLSTCTESGLGRHMVQLTRALETGLLAVRRRLGRDISGAEVRLERTRADYQNRRRDLMALDRLHEHRYQAWREAVQAAEQSDLDEMARVRFVARTREETR